MGQLLKDTIDKTVTLGQSSWTVTLGHRGLDSFKNTVDETVMLEYNRWDNYIRTKYIGELL